MNITLAELAANSDIFKEWNEQSRREFAVGTFYTTFDSPCTWEKYIKKSERNKLEKRLKGKTLETHEIESNRIWEFTIRDEKKEYHFYIWTSDNIWVVFAEKKPAFNNLFKNLVKYSRGISHAWISPSQMKEIIDKYANIGTLQAISKSPSFKIPKRAPIPVKTMEKLPDIFFKEMGATIQFWAPREVLQSEDQLTYEELKISRDYLNRISKSIFSTKFDNPGKSKISVEEDSIISHEGGVPKATEIVFNNIFKKSSLWINAVEDCIPEFEIRYNTQGEISTLYYKKKPKEMHFLIRDESGFSRKHLVKLEQILISGSGKTELVGYRVSSDSNTVSLRVMYPRFGQDARVDLTLDDRKIHVVVFPYSNSGPHILSHIYRMISEKFAWFIEPFEVRDRWIQGKIGIQT